MRGLPFFGTIRLGSGTSQSFTGPQAANEGAVSSPGNSAGCGGRSGRDRNVWTTGRKYGPMAGERCRTCLLRRHVHPRTGYAHPPAFPQRHRAAATLTVRPYSCSQCPLRDRNRPGNAFDALVHGKRCQHRMQILTKYKQCAAGGNIPPRGRNEAGQNILAHAWVAGGQEASRSRVRCGRRVPGRSGLHVLIVL